MDSFVTKLRQDAHTKALAEKAFSKGLICGALWVASLWTVLWLVL